MNKVVGIVGLGIMGGAIARNLVERGWQVVGYDHDAERRAEMARANVTIATDAKQVARDTPILMTSLPSAAAVEDVARAIANSGQSPRIVIELSTLAIADKLRFEDILTKAGPARRQGSAILWSMPAATAPPLPAARSCSPISPGKAPISAHSATAAG